jgi:hypothetical protein
MKIIIQGKDSKENRAIQVLLGDALHDFIRVRGGYRGLDGCQEYVEERYSPEYRESYPTKANQVLHRCEIAAEIINNLIIEEN